MWRRFWNWLIWSRLSRLIGIPVLVNDFNHFCNRLYDLFEKVRLLEERINRLEPSFKPIVLFDASYEFAKDQFCPACWFESPIENVVTTNLMQFRRLNTIRLLNGPYEIVQILIGNISFMEGSFWPAGVTVPIPTNLQEVGPGSRIKVIIRHVET